jgi:hypothetical protein
MKSNKFAVPAVMLVSLGMLAPVATLAQESSHYANVRTYMRTAQLLMRVPERPNVQLTMKPADDDLDAAIKAMDQAGAVAPKDRVDRPQVKGDLAQVEQFKNIVELLHAARNEMGQETSHSSAAAWRAGVLQHINAALEAVHQAAVNAHLDREIGSF